MDSCNLHGGNLIEAYQMTAEEEAKCHQVVALFEDFIGSQRDLCVAWTERHGFVVLYDLVEGRFEASMLCRNAREIFHELMRLWELDYLYDTGSENGCEDFESSEEGMTDRQRTYREEKRAWYHNRLEEICASSEIDRTAR